MVLYAVGGILGQVYMTIFSVILLIFPFVIVLKKKQGLSSLGFCKKNLWPSLGLGLSCGIVALIFNKGILFAIIYGWKLEPFGFLVYQFLYYLVGIALIEEVIFRGYIQTRLYGIFRNNVSAVLTGALMFSLMHVPNQLAKGNVELNLALLIWLATCFIWHIVFNLIYVKYNSIFGPILLHTLMDWSNEIFVNMAT